MGLSIVLFCSGVMLITFQLRQLIFPTRDYSPERNAEIRGWRVLLVIVGVGLIGLAFNVYPVNEPFGGAPYPRSRMAPIEVPSHPRATLIPALVIEREGN